MKYRIIEVTESLEKNGFKVGQIIEGTLFKNADFVDMKNFKADVISIKNTDYCIYASQVEELN